MKPGKYCSKQSSTRQSSSCSMFGGCEVSVKVLVTGKCVLCRPSNSSTRKGEARPKWKPEAKVPLQTLHMTSENQEKVKALLRDLQEQDADAGSE